MIFALFVCARGIYVPPHVPMQEVGPVAEFEVPWWLGGFVASVNESSEWVLPLTYVSGGKTNTGTTLVIQNRGPFNITLYSSDPETIQGLASYLVVADSTVQFLSATDWVVVSATFGDEGTDGSFGYLQAENASVACWLGVGTSNPANKRCGDLTATQFLSIGDDSAVSAPDMGFRLTRTMTSVSSTPGTTHQLHRVIAIVAPSVTPNSNAWRVSETVTSVPSSFDFNPGQVFNRYDTFIYSGSASQTSASTFAFCNHRVDSRVTTSASTPVIIANWVNHYSSFSFLSGTTSTIQNYRNIFAAAPTLGSGTFSTYYSSFETSPMTVTGVTTLAGFVCGIQTGGTNNYAFWVNSNTASSGAGYCAGTAGDVCMWRAAANAWTFGASTSLRVPQYLGVGSSSAPTNTVAGAFSTTKATPTLQAFGAVVANAASGTLAFTVSTAAVTCATAVVTNTNVVAGSEVILTIQSYTGTKFTNGIPTIERSDTAGSSAGSFTLQLCNTHATNALSGNLFVAFWVLN